MSMAETNDLPPVQILSSMPITTALTAVLLIIVVIGLFSLFFCRCFLKRHLFAWDLQQTPTRELFQANPPENPGLDPKTIRSFPVFPYSAMRAQWMECSICLSDFSDDDTVRLITACRHAFHTNCIDLWFESHKTCPVCRCELDPDQISAEKSSAILGVNLISSGSHESLNDTVMIVVQEDVPEWNGEDLIGNSNDMSESNGRQMEGFNPRFLRSHSTGHSIIWARIDDIEEEEEKYSLRLLENVNVKITRGHSKQRAASHSGNLHGSIEWENTDGLVISLLDP